jgi:DNA-binding beta-propeller fold protein YncE
MRCEPHEVVVRPEETSKTLRKNRWKTNFPAAAALLATSLAVACGSGQSVSQNPPPPPGASQLFLVANASGNVAGFTDSSGKFTAIPGSTVMFPPLLTEFAAAPSGTFLATASANQQGQFTLRIANIGAGGALTSTQLSTPSANPGGLAISSQGLIAVTDSINSTVQLMQVQNNMLVQGPSTLTGPIPQDAVFSADGSRLYVGNNGNGSVSVFSISNVASMPQLVQTAHLPVAAGEFTPGIVRVTLSSSGMRFAATTFDGRLFVGTISAMDGTLSGFTETVVGAMANLEEVVFDPAEKNVYTADQDHGGIFGFTLGAGGTVTPLPGSPFSTGNLPGGPTGMAFNSAGDRLYVVIGAQSAVFTFSRDTNTGQLAFTGDAVSSGGLIGGRIARVPEH